ncbi:MAG: DUF4352 domain-containing protein [Dehalococcoidia bacterium]
MRLVVLATVLALTFTACLGDGGSDGGVVVNDRAELERRDADLRRTFEDAIETFLDGDVEGFYEHFSSDFQSRCERNDFRAILAFATVFIGDLSDRDATVDITDVRFEDDRAFVQAKIDVEGTEFDDAEGEGSFSDFWVLEDGEWKADTDEEDPCDLGDGLFGEATITAGTDDDDDDAPSGPGRSRGEAVAIGESVITNDLQLTVLNVNPDAAAEVIAEDDFVAPPSAGNRYVLIRLRAEHAGEGEETRSVSGSDFSLTGSRDLVYDNFEHGCGFYSGEINGEMFPGGSLEGAVCFEVPADETNLILIAAPFFSFDDGDKRFLALE